MAKIEEMTVRVLCAQKNAELIKMEAKSQNVVTKEISINSGTSTLEMTASIASLFQIAYQCGHLEIGITVF